MRDKLFIDGDWVVPEQGGRLPVVNPATEEVIHHIAAATEEDVDRAVAAALRAFSSWRRTTATERATYLRRIASQLREQADELARLETLDMGKVFADSLFDVNDSAGVFDYYASQAEALDRRQGEALESPDDFQIHVRYEPVGVAGLIVPWNFPLVTAAWKVAPALAAGCTIVLKPSEIASLTCLELGAISRAVGLPKGVFNVVTGTGPAAGAPLSNHPDVAKVSFTGSGATGRQVMLAATNDFKRVTLELGGKSALIVFDDADLDAAVNTAMYGVFWNQGEVCSATSRVLVQDTIAEEFTKRLVNATEKIRVGDPFADGVHYGPMVDERQYAKVMDAIERGRADGARLVTGGERPPGQDTGYFIRPTVFVDVPKDAWIWREEIFGPVLALRSFADESDAIAEANDSEYGLAAAVVSGDRDRTRRVSEAMEAGCVWINCSGPVFVQGPWGGYKRSGIGRECGPWGMDAFLEVKQIVEYVASEPFGWNL